MSKEEPKTTVVKGIRASEDSWDNWDKASVAVGKKSRNDWVVRLLDRASSRILRKEKNK
jgi:hypothetical protein